MRSAKFASLESAEIVELDFATRSGTARHLTLLVDSGFTGSSCFILGKDETDLIQAIAEPAHAMGALRGEQTRVWVSCEIFEIGFRKTSIAILTDLEGLSLPHNVGGMVGLSFLRCFDRWASEKTSEGWQFSLSLRG